MSGIVSKKIEDPAVFQMMRAVGLRILAVRKRQKLSQKAVCEILCACTVSQYARWEVGSRMANPFVMSIFCRKFEVSMDYIYRGVRRGSDAQPAEEDASPFKN